MKTLARTADLTEIVGRLQRLRPDCAARWGRLSVHQMICHQSDACRMAMGETPVTPASGLLRRTLWKWVALYLPLPWPQGIPTVREIDQRAGGSAPREFAADLAELTALVERLADSEHRVDWPPHPIFGRLSRRAWLRWGYRHADHHLRQFGC